MKISATKVVENMSDEKAAADRCEGLLSLPAEWHKKKVKPKLYINTSNPVPPAV